MLNIVKLTLSILLAVQLIDANPVVPYPFSRVSGKSFYPNKALNVELLNVKVDVNPKTIPKSGPKSLIPKQSVGFTFCKACIDFADDALNELLNAVLNVGIVGSCNELCSYVASKTGSQIVDVVCNLLCDYVGISEFIKVIENADLDPIYYCELLKACPINDNGDANITSLTVSPQKGPQGVFVVDLKYESLNGTGTGELYIGINTVDKIPVEDSFLLEAAQPGKYETQIRVNAQPDPDCDPTQGPCEAWLAGNYEVQIAICNGECGSSHPHSKIYSQGTTKFTITN